MYSAEQRAKAIETFARFGCSAADTIPGTGSPKPFYALMQDSVPDLGTYGGNQCFPLYWYEKTDDLDGLFAGAGRFEKREAISDEALSVFQTAYPGLYTSRPKTKGGQGINKEDILYYIYGVLRSPEYRQRFEANLKLELPRIPLARDFNAFAQAGRVLADLHLNYESVEMYPIEVDGDDQNPGKVVKMKWGKKKDPETGKKVDDHSVLVYNGNLAFRGIPASVDRYVVNGRTPLEWMIDRYQVKTDKASGIVNDPNEYSDDPCYISNLIKRLITVSVRTVEIVDTLPDLNELDQPANWPFAWKAQG